MKQEIFSDRDFGGEKYRDKLNILIEQGYTIDAFYSSSKSNYDWTIIAHKQEDVSTSERDIADKALRDAINYVHDDNDPARNSEYINSHEEIWIEQYLNNNFPLTNKTV